MTEASSLYSILGLTKEASSEDIRRAYHDAARRLHPDVNLLPGATEAFLRVQNAYDILSDPDKRASYDTVRPSELEPSVIASNILYSRAALPKVSEQQIVYVCLELSALKNLDLKKSAHLNVCLVLDRSTSMRGERMDTVKTAAIELVRQLHPDDILSIVTFSDRADVLVSSGRRLDRHDIETRIRMIHPSGGTEILRGLEAGLFEVKRHVSADSVSHLILLTDGRTYGDEAECLQLAEQAGSHGVGIYGLGIGEEWNDRFLDDIATRTGGSCMYVAKSSDVQRFLQEKINDLEQTYAKQVTLSLDLGPGVQLKDVYRLQPEPMPLPNNAELRLGNIGKNSALKLILEFLVAPIPGPLQQILLASGALNLEISSLNPSHYQVNIHLARPTSDVVKYEIPPRPIFDAVSRITLYRIQEQARQEANSGNTQSASRHLQHLATHLISQGERELANAVLLEAERVHNSQALSIQGEKRIKFGTRALLLPANIQEGKP